MLVIFRLLAARAELARCGQRSTKPVVGPASDLLMPPGYQYLGTLAENKTSEAGSLIMQARRLDDDCLCVVKTPTSISQTGAHRYSLHDWYKNEWTMGTRYDPMSNLQRFLQHDYYESSPHKKIPFRPFIISEYIPGIMLHEVAMNMTCSDRVPRLGQLALLAIDLIAALRQLRRFEIVHRDLKPSNVIVTPQGHAVLIDFAVSTLDADARNPEKLCGSPDYIPPEINHLKLQDHRGDVYALGILLYTQWTWKLPLGAGRMERPSAATSWQAPVHAHLNVGHAIPPDGQGSILSGSEQKKLPPDLRSLLVQMTQVDPDQRLVDHDKIEAQLRSQI